jgi:hypothetical protein
VSAGDWWALFGALTTLTVGVVVRRLVAFFLPPGHYWRGVSRYAVRDETYKEGNKDETESQ